MKLNHLTSAGKGKIIEIKAHCSDFSNIKKILNQQSAKFIGVDYQKDSYFFSPKGRLKLREGNIENNFIYYERKNQKGPKKSTVILYQSHSPEQLKLLLTEMLGLRTVVTKVREIYFIDNIKFHLDQVEGLGTFIEIEAIDVDGTLTEKLLYEQCNYYLNLFCIKTEDLVRKSYSDIQTDDLGI